MAPAENEFEHESLQDRESIVHYLRAISEGISAGHLELKNTDTGIHLEPIGLLNLKVKAVRNNGKSKLTLKLSWKGKKSDADDHPLRIESK